MGVQRVEEFSSNHAGGAVQVQGVRKLTQVGVHNETRALLRSTLKLVEPFKDIADGSDLRLAQ
jgi:hypothetical protein